MSKESRAPYEFSLETKQTIYDRQNGQCAITGRTDNLECHHILAIAIATGFWPKIAPEILKQSENGVYLSVDVHKQLHDEMRKWPKEFFKAYTVGLYSYLRDYYEENKPIEVTDWPKENSFVEVYNSRKKRI